NCPARPTSDSGRSRHHGFVHSPWPYSIPREVSTFLGNTFAVARSSDEINRSEAIVDLSTTIGLTWIIFALTYLGLALGRVPGLRMDRAGTALFGPRPMRFTRLLTLEQAISPDSIDYKTLILLFGMMVVVAFLRLSGFFQRLTRKALKKIRTPLGLLAVTI